MLSVVICTYNRAEKLRRVLNDILNNPLNEPLDFELILVDNNSEDQTKSLVIEFDALLSNRLHYVLEKKQGLSNARNRGIHEAKGEWICFTDDDVRLDKDWLTSIAAAIKGHPKMAAYGGRIKANWVEEPPKWFIREGKFAMNGGAIVSCDLGNSIFTMNERRNVNPVGANMGFRKEVFDKIGMFHPDWGKKGNSQCLGDDTEFCNRVRDEGYEILYLPDSLVWHDIEIDRLQVPIMKQFYFELGFFHGKESMFSDKTVWLFGAPRYLFRAYLSYLLKSLGLRFISLGKSRYYLFMFHYVRGTLKGCYERKQ